MNRKYNITTDPAFYITILFFALLTTAVPAAMGQQRFLPATQSLSLTVFAGIAIRQQRIRQAIWVFALWLTIQFVVMVLLTWFLGSRIERAIPSGFDYRTAVATWFYTDTPYPRGIIATPWGKFAEFIAITFGSLISGGLIGNWFLVRAANLAGFGVGTLLLETKQPFALPLLLPIWSLLQIAGYAGIVIWLSQPILTNRWSPSYYWREQKRLITLAVILLLLGLLLGALLAPIWKFAV